MQLQINEIIEHKLNYNNMSPSDLKKLKKLIKDEGTYPPLIVNKRIDGSYMLLDGHQRLRVLKEMGHKKVKVDLWEIPIEQELVALATINELKGKKNQYKRELLMKEILKNAKEKKEVLKQMLTRKNLDLAKAQESEKKQITRETKYQLCQFLSRDEYKETTQYINENIDRKDLDKAIYLIIQKVKKYESDNS